ncbi:hypothetical protein GCM10025867_24140 [Frondihabitans sucicola]|uniref:Cobalamin-independent methionine synthase MetE N-terminal domain-containing protein n=1 Tax=Frondihabitans sucicola TaxID=1268041 RepID=A0ABN6XYZ4_9MICO|nr:hypothetical protein GCM10025867_24140 [Frondihabitans sucicola]
MTTTSSSFPTASILGYPRVGARRELKRAIESHWAGTSSLDELETAARALRSTRRARLAELGLSKTDSSIPEDFSFYDQVLDTALAVGAIPTRFADVAEGAGRETEFLLARGTRPTRRSR